MFSTSDDDKRVCERYFQNERVIPLLHRHFGIADFWYNCVVAEYERCFQRVMMPNEYAKDLFRTME